jgi:large conductance mechanosensitive channel
MLKEFKEFAMKGNMIDLAVGLAIGTAFGAVVKSLVDDIITPAITGIFKIPDFSNQFLVLKNPTEETFATLAAAKTAGATVFAYGSFINILIAFFLMAWALFLVVKGINRLKRAEEKKEEAKPKDPTELDVLMEIRDSLKK